MTKAQLDEYIEREAANKFDLNGMVDYYDKPKYIEGAQLLAPLLLEAIEALKFECGGRCAQGINPCNARETLDKIEERLR